MSEFMTSDTALQALLLPQVQAFP